MKNIILMILAVVIILIGGYYYADKFNSQMSQNQLQNQQEVQSEENQENIHLQDIEPKDLTYDDLIIFDKLLKGNLTNEDDEEYKKYREDVSRYFDFQQKSNGNNFDIRRDSRANFAAMIRNKIIEIETKARIEEIRKRKAEGKSREISL